MARKPRLEFAGAIYHTINRGNYRKDVFADRSAEAFKRTLFEASAKCHWCLHSYVIISNHYHLALETAERGNISRRRSEGTPWNIRVAAALRSQTTATNAWIAQRLVMSHPSRARNLIRDSEKL
ncbi:MAG: transposase [Chthoniobacterales bacterium]|nr:transposase [Chthoniobacterales bacterium]